MKFDIIFHNATIVDGTGSPSYVSDVAIHGDRIAKIGNIEEDALRVIDVSGLHLTPGFIDSHGHNDLNILTTTDNKYKLEQGVTTEICGQCGVTVAPVSESHYLERNLNSLISNMIPNSNDRAKFTTTKKWFDYVSSKKHGTNNLIHIGQGTLRETVMGYENRDATLEELYKMKCILIEAMKSGAIGLSSGLAYIPGNFTPHEEIIELCKIVAEYKGVYSTHLKNQGEDLEKCILDSIDISEKSGCKTIISHLKSIGKPNWGKVSNAIKLISLARERGVCIYFDVYPYVCGSTTLTVTLPPSILEGGKNETLKKLHEYETHLYIQEQFRRQTEKWENAIGYNGYNSIMILSAKNTPDASGLTIEEYSKKINIGNFEAYIKLLIENNLDVKTINFVMSEEDVVAAISSPLGTIGSDGSCLPNDTVTHPRAVGTFTRYLGSYIRDQGILSIEQAIKKITSFPADIYNIKDRGIICEGAYADIVIFNYDTIIDKADFINSFEKNIGIEYVLVNGKISVEKSAYNGENYGNLIFNSHILS